MQSSQPNFTTTNECYWSASGNGYGDLTFDKGEFSYLYVSIQGASGGYSNQRYNGSACTFDAYHSVLMTSASNTTVQLTTGPIAAQTAVQVQGK